MLCFTTNRSRITSGLSVEDNEKLGKVVFLGERGRGRTYKNVSLSRKTPAVVQDGDIVLEAEIHKVTLTQPKEFIFYTLKKPQPQNKDSRIILRVNTSGVYTRNTSGNWKIIQGNVKNVVEGNGATGAAGRTGSWVDSIVIMEEGSAIRVKPFGGYKTPGYIVWYENASRGPKVLSEEEFSIITSENEHAEAL